jgi:hypothetical protein
MKLHRCDNKKCNKDIPQGAEYFTVTREGFLATYSDPNTDREFCSAGCVAEFYAEQCGWGVKKS